MFVQALIMAAIVTCVMTVGRFFVKEQPSINALLRDFILGFIANLGVSWVVLWVGLPAMTGWLGGYFALLMPLFIALVLCGFSLWAREGSGRYGDPEANSIGSSFITGCVVFVCLVGFFALAAAYPVYGANALRNIPQITESSEQIEEASVEHIRLVPQEAAEFLGKQVIGTGNLGALYELGTFEIQRIKGRLYWAAPLEFRGFWQWWNIGTSPGYVLVNAEESVQQAELHQGYKMRYLPSAQFGDNLHRFLYENGYDKSIILEPTFEVDEDMHPWWVVTVGRPSVGLGGEVVDGAVLVDPENGKMQYYPLGETPAWVDRVTPFSLSIKYANWWGKYVNGWWNSWTNTLDVQEVTYLNGKQDAFLVWGRDDHAKWFAGLTSPSNKDTALTGYMMMDSVTGQTTFYRVSGVGNESAVVDAVNSQVAFKKWHGAQPIFYQIYGVPTWLVPVLATNTGLIQQVALVNAGSLHVVLGATKQNALADYARWLVEQGSNRSPTQDSQLQEAEGRVTRIAADVREGRKVFYFVLDTVPDRIFTADSSASDKIVLTQSGDRVQVQFADTGERTVAVQRFGNVDVQGDVPVVPKTPATVNTPTVSMSPTPARTPAPTPTPTPTPMPTPQKQYAE